MFVVYLGVSCQHNPKKIERKENNVFFIPDSLATPEQIDFAVSFAKAVVYVAVVIGSILLIFEVLCGLKCSMYGKWRIGAIVFGVLLCLDYVLL